MAMPILDVRRDMIVVGPGGRRYCAVGREMSLPGSGVWLPWLRLHLQDLETGVMSVIQYRVTDAVQAEWPPDARHAEPDAAADGRS